MKDTSPPVFDAARFAGWLRRWKEAEGFQWAELEHRSGLGKGTLHNFTKGYSGTTVHRAKGSFNPPINSLAGIAHGLDLELGYVIEQGGLDTGHKRWSNFSSTERVALLAALSMATGDSPVLMAIRADLASYEREERSDGRQ